MIVVFADDFTGAAEIAATARHCGCRVELLTQVESTVTTVNDAEIDVVVLDTATRSWPPAASAARLSKLAELVLAWHPQWIYKKIDSVLRGPIAHEVDALVKAFQCTGVLICPANPGRGRLVKNGRVEIDGVALDQTSFVNDPEHPARTASAIELIGLPAAAIKLVNPGDPLDGWCVANVSCTDDLDVHVRALPDRFLPAGGAQFFSALLRQRLAHVPHACAQKTQLPRPGLIVCGSTAGWESRLDFCKEKAIPFIDIVALVNQHSDIASILSHVSAAWHSRGVALLAIGQVRCTAEQLTVHRQIFFSCIGELLKYSTPEILVIEGGNTASGLLAQQGWQRFTASECIDEGLVILRPDSFHAPLVMAKPGSYPWNHALRDQY